MFEELLQKAGFWSQKGPSGDVVLSTRVRLARNIPSLHFPSRQEEHDYSVLMSTVKRFAAESSMRDGIRVLSMDELSDSDRRFLRERTVITSELEASPRACVIIHNEGDFVIMVNEEDHFRIQVIKPGFQVTEAYQLADSIDNELNRFVSYAYSEEFGYLTSCPSNIGTGLKISVMLHLPLVAQGGELADLARELHGRNVVIRGVTGKELETVGNLYLLANQISLGVSEVDIIEMVDAATRLCIEREDARRDVCLVEYGVALENRIWRSLGLLKYSRCIEYIEALDHLSNIRLGIVLSLIKNIDLYKINDLMVNIQRVHLERIAGSSLSGEDECDIFRAQYLKKELEQL